MKSKSIVFFIAIASFFFSHCTNLSSYHSPFLENYQSPNPLAQLNMDMQLNSLEAKIEKNKEYICELYTILHLKHPEITSNMFSVCR